MKYLLLLLPLIANAGGIDGGEMEMLTDVGAVTLYATLCTHEPPKQGFDYQAQATEGAIVHKGCWGKDGGSVHIWFYDEPQQLFIASYGRYYFKPKPKPNL